MEGHAAEYLRITLVQSELYWEQPVANRAHLEELIWQHTDETDLLVLPEMFTTGFSMNPKNLAEAPGTATQQWMLQIAKQRQACVAGSYMVKEGGLFFNRFLWVFPDGRVAHYDKKHLFSLAGEHEAYKPGNARPVIELKGWKLCPLVCYDLRFPIWSRNIGGHEYDCLVYTANWPAPREQAWRTLLRARAIENLSYCIGVNRVGTDEKGLVYNGYSAAVDMKGAELYEAEAGKTALHTVTLAYEPLQSFRNRFPFFNDADAFQWV